MFSILEKVFNLILLSTILIVPLLTPNFNLGYEQIKVRAFFGLISFLALNWFILILTGRILVKKIAILDVGFFLFFTTLFISSTLGADPYFSFFGRDPYLQGLFLYLYLFIFYLMISTSNLTLRNWILSFSISGFLISIYAIFQYLGLNYFQLNLPNYAGRVVSTFGQPNFYSGYLVLLVPFFLLIKVQNNLIKRWFQITTFFCVLAIFLSFSRAAIGIFVLLIFLLLVEKLKVSKKLIILLFVSVLLLSTIISLKLKSGFLYSEIVIPMNVTNPKLLYNPVEKRIFFWPILGEQVLKRPIFGYGLENVNEAYSSYLPPENLRETTLFGIKDLNLDRAHNYTLDLLISSGILGFLSWLLIIILLFSNAKKKKIYVLSLFVYLIWVQFQIQSIVHLMFFYWLSGMIRKENKL